MTPDRLAELEQWAAGDLVAPGLITPVVVAELIAAVRDLQTQLRRSSELLESCRAQSVSLMRQRDDALAETERLRERLLLTMQIDAELKRQP